MAGGGDLARRLVATLTLQPDQAQAAPEETPAIASAPPPVVTPPAPAEEPTPAPSGTPTGATPLPTGFVEGKSKLDDTKTTEVRREFDNPDGTRTMELHSKPVRFRDEAGRWVDIDLSLADKSDGKLAAKAARRSAKLAKKSAGDVVMLDGPFGQLTMRHHDATNATAEITGRSATYRGGLSGGRDLIESLTVSGVEESVVLPNAASGASYTVEFGLPGKLSARQGAAGVEFVDGATVVASFGGGYAFDAAAPPAEAPVAVRLVEVKNTKATVVVEVDQAWLSDPRRVFPATIDPYLEYAVYASQSPNFDGCADSVGTSDNDTYRSCYTYVNSDNPVYGAYSGQTQLRSGSNGLCDAGYQPPCPGNENRTRTYVQWPTDSFGAYCPACTPVIDYQYTVISAYVRLYSYGGNSSAGYTLLSGAADRSAKSTTWNTQSYRDSYGMVDYAYFGGGGGYVYWNNVKALAQRWFDSPANKGIVLEANDERANSNYRQYYSGEAGVPPMVSITYNRPPSPATPASPADGATVSTQPALSVNPSVDPDHNTVEYQFRITNPSGAAVNNSSWTTSTSYTPPAGTLAPGTSYYWNTYTRDGVHRRDVPPAFNHRFTTGIALKANSDELGLEQFYPYDRIDLGSASGHVNLRTGNLVVSQDDAFVPRQGLNVGVRRVYNSTDTTNPDGLGVGWRLSTTDLDAGLEGVVGAITDLDVSAGLTLTDLFDSVAGKVLTFTDGDGTTHRFVRPGGAGTRWESPPGVSLRVREAAAADGFGAGYELVRPDGVTYRANLVIDVPPMWRVTSVADRNGNRLFYDYELRIGLPLPQGRLVAIRHNRDAAQVVVRLDYDLFGQLSAIVALPGSSSVDPATGTVRSWERTTRLGYTAGRLSSVVHNEQATPAMGNARRASPTTATAAWPLSPTGATPRPASPTPEPAPPPSSPGSATAGPRRGRGPTGPPMPMVAAPPPPPDRWAPATRAAPGSPTPSPVAPPWPTGVWPAATSWPSPMTAPTPVW